MAEPIVAVTDTKPCGKCKTVVLLKDFPNDKSRADGKHPYCRACHRAHAATYYAKHREAITTRTSAYLKAHPEMKANATKKWRKANPEKYRACMKKFRDAHPEVGRATTAKRRALKRGASRIEKVGVNAFYRQVQVASRIVCYWCHKTSSKGQRHVDHIMPLSRGGSHIASNLAASCASCNIAKRNSLPEQFSSQLLLL